MPCAQRSAARATPAMPAASNLSAGLLGWNLGLTPIYLVHAAALNSFGYKCALATGVFS